MIDNRLLGAVAIAFAGAVFGFATGRFSAWLVPLCGVESASATAKPSVPLQPTTVAKEATRPSPPLESTSSITAVVLDSPKAPTSASAQKPAEASAEAKGAVAPAGATIEPQMIARALNPDEPPGDASRSDTRVINAGSADRLQAQEAASTGGDPRSLTAGPDAQEACRRKFRSFDPTDGTYKPFGQDVRVPCPYIAR